MGLPFGYSKCSRGGGGKPPRCHEWFSIQNSEQARSTPAEPKIASGAPLEMVTQAIPNRPRRRRRSGSGLRRRSAALRVLGDGVHSGSARTPLSDESTDNYPVPLKQETLRPGTVYADPYGHVLMLVRRVPQTSGAAGVFLAVDGQPDGTVARKRFWRGNFLFAQNTALGGPGFKRFRPIVTDKSGAERRLTNEEIAKNPQYADYSLDQARLTPDAFYDRMDDVMSPAPLDPMRRWARRSPRSRSR